MKYAGGLVVLIALLALGAILVRGKSGHTPIPPVFAEGLTIADAAKRAAGSDKPVLVFATADWCLPCQEFKRTTLLDPAVSGWISDNAVPVYLDIDRSRQDAAGLSIIAIPTSIMMRDGKAVARISGVVASDEYIAWLNAASARDSK